MQRYFIQADKWTDDGISIIDDDAKHIAVVMRMQTGDEVICVHPTGETAICRIEHIEKNLVHASIKEIIEQTSELPVKVTIIQGLPKGNKTEFILQKGTELGAIAFQFFIADRSIVKWDTKKAEQKINRFEKIVKEAAEQAHRNKVPEIGEVTSLQSIIQSKSDVDLILFADEALAREKEHPSLQHLLQELPLGSHISVVIGPEGGLTDKERQLLLSNGAKAVRFGPRILRTETAALYALACVSYQFEESE